MAEQKRKHSAMSTFLTTVGVVTAIYSALGTVECLNHEIDAFSYIFGVISGIFMCGIATIIRCLDENRELLSIIAKRKDDDSLKAPEEKV